MTRREFEHDAFISYNHKHAVVVARALERGMERLAKPLLALRAIDVFRDETELTADASLWDTLAHHLAGSQWLVLVASPEFAASRWCRSELDWWLEHRSSERLLFVLGDGHIVWDEAAGDFDWDQTTALPDVLRGKLASEPLYVDLRWARDGGELELDSPRFREAVVSVAAPIRGRTRDELDSEDTRQQRRNRRLVRGLWTGVGFGAIAALALAAVAWDQRQEAIEQRDEARLQETLSRSRELATSSRIAAQTRLDRALLLSAAAVQLTETREARGVLINHVHRYSTATHILRGHRGALLDVAFTPDSQRVRTASVDGTVVTWDVNEGVPLQQQRAQDLLGESMEGSFSRMILADDATHVAIYMDLPELGFTAQRVAVVALDREPSPLVFETDEDTYEAFSSGGRLFAQLTALPKRNTDDPREDGDYRLPRALRVEVLGTGEHRTHELPEMLTPRRLALGPEGRTLALVNELGGVDVWDVDEPHRKFSTPQSIVDPTSDFEFSPDGEYLAAIVGEELLRYSLADGKVDSGWDHGNAVNISHSSDGRWLSLTAANGHVRLFSAHGEHGVHGHAQLASRAVSPDGKWLATASVDSTLVLWRLSPDDSTDEPQPPSLAVEQDRATLASRSKLHALDSEYMDSAYVRAVDHGGHAIITAADTDDTMTLWRLDDDPPGPHQLPRVHGNDRATAGTFGPKGERFATASFGKIAIWDTASGQPEDRLLEGHEAYIDALAFSSDQRMLASASQTSAIVWELATGEQLVRLPLDLDYGIQELVFGPGDDWLFALHHGGHLTWNLSTEQLVAHACALLDPGLEPAQWTSVLPGVPYPETCPRRGPWPW